MEKGVLKILVKSLQNTDQGVHVFVKLQPTSLLKANLLRVLQRLFSRILLWFKELPMALFMVSISYVSFLGLSWFIQFVYQILVGEYKDDR